MRMHLNPKSFTVISTYHCTAECKECCFECSPRIKQRLPQGTMLAAIAEAKESFPSIEVVVFTGGECFTLKQDLYDAIKLASSLNMSTRCVTNAYWGKTKHLAERVVGHLVEANLNEINISTGNDHQAYIPIDSVINASEVLVSAGISTIVTIESDLPGGNCINSFLSDDRVKYMMSEFPHLFQVKVNTWMPFKSDYEDRPCNLTKSEMFKGCDQVLTNVVLTPNGRLAACCGLTFEHIPEMTLGDYIPGQMKSVYNKVYSDFMKIWLHVSGPAQIIKSVMGDDVEEELLDLKHPCQACVILHKHRKIISEIESKYMLFSEDILSRYSLKILCERSFDGSADKECSK